MLDRAVLYDFDLAGRRLRLWKRLGESYEHVLMKALGYTMFIGEYPTMEIEKNVGLRYKPDLCAQTEDGRFAFWGECGSTGVRKIAWLLKHAGVRQLVLFKLAGGGQQFVAELRAGIAPPYRLPGRLSVVSFSREIVEQTVSRRIARVPQSWYSLVEV